MTEDSTKSEHTPGPWKRYAREPRIRVSATGQSTGPYYTKDTVEYVRGDIADAMLAELKALADVYGSEPNMESTFAIIAKAEGR